MEVKKDNLVLIPQPQQQNNENQVQVPTQQMGPVGAFV
jgi:hypothetical protein